MSVRVPTSCDPYLAADKLPEITVIAAQVSPGTRRMAVERSKTKLERLVNEEDALVIG